VVEGGGRVVREAGGRERRWHGRLVRTGVWVGGQAGAKVARLPGCTVSLPQCLHLLALQFPYNCVYQSYTHYSTS